jgi:hypothetical protein
VRKGLEFDKDPANFICEACAVLLEAHPELAEAKA